jgi:hypothetical protein
MSPDTSSPPTPFQLMEAAAGRQRIEVILVIRGRVQRTRDGRWRMRAHGGRVVTFADAWVLAATPIRSRAGGVAGALGPRGS